MPRLDGDRAPHNLIQQIEQVAQLVSSARSPTVVLRRALQLLGETLGACGGTVVLHGGTSRHTQAWSWGEYQQQLVQLEKSDSRAR